WVLTALPMILASYASSFEAVRTALRTALAAKPAPAVGEDEQCRNCGGVLEAADTALHARCVYCDADNLVHLDRARLDEAVGELKVVARDLQSALAEERSTARAGRVRAAIRLAQWLALAPLMIILGRCVASINENDAFFWEGADADAPMMPKNEANPVLPRGEPVRFAVHDTFDDCDDTRCIAYYFVPLQVGERPRLDVEGGDLRLGHAQQRFVGPWYNPTYEWRHVDLDEGAPYSGWYRIELVTSVDRGPEPLVTFR
ncbi:MAG TPA: hypothetical protein VG755_12805, partial [Nannocystaceae bacterium]|nr:hypothetical protein [Nannocystaceae bacterium]